MSAFLAGLTSDGGILRVRSLFTLGIAGGFIYGFLIGLPNGEAIPSEVFVPVLSGVVAYYFGSRNTG